MNSYVIYARKSTESEDRQVLSIDSQVRELHQVAARRGVAVSEVLTEARSAKAPGRPVFGNLMRRIDRHQIRGVICWKMDRLARNHLDTGAILQALADGKLEEVITSDRTYTRDGNDRFMGNFELGIATKFIDDLRANVKRGNRARLHRGWPNFLPPLGYLNDRLTKTIVKDPERFDLVRRMWELMLTGTVRPSQIRAIANTKWGFRTRQFKRTGGQPLTASALYKIFSNPYYMGVIRLRSGGSFPGSHPVMVTREEFTRVQEILGRPGRPRPKRHEFAYTGLLRCGNCGASVSAEEHVKPSGRRYVYYRCSWNRTGTTCREAAVPEAVLEAQIDRILSRLTIPDRVLDWILARVRQTLANEQARSDAARRMLEEALAAVRREAGNLLTLRLKELLPDETYMTRKREMDERERSLQARLAAPMRSRDELAELTASTFQFAARAAETFRSGTSVQRRMILEAVGLNSTLQDRKLRILLKNPFNLIADAGSLSNWCTRRDLNPRFLWQRLKGCLKRLWTRFSRRFGSGLPRRRRDRGGSRSPDLRRSMAAKPAVRYYGHDRPSGLHREAEDHPSPRNRRAPIRRPSVGDGPETASLARDPRRPATEGGGGVIHRVGTPSRLTGSRGLSYGRGSST